MKHDNLNCSYMELECCILRNLPRNRKSGVHQSGAGQRILPVVDRIHGIGVKPFCADIFLRSVAGKVRNDYA